MFLNVFAAEAIRGITKENVEACGKLRQSNDWGPDNGFYRSYLLYVVLAAVCNDYIEECGLKPGDELFDDIAEHLSGLASVMHGKPGVISPDDMGKVMADESIDIGDTIFGGIKRSYLPLERTCINKIMEMLYIFIGLYVILGREKCMGVCDNIIKALTDTSSGKNNDDSKVDFDL